MKIIIFILLSTSALFAQYANGISANSGTTEFKDPERYILQIETTSTKESVSNLTVDLNTDGHREILAGQKIIPLEKNRYWLKEVSLKTSSGVIYYFGTVMEKNDVSLVNQVSAVNGYILILTEGNETAEVYIAGEFGNINSDPFMVSLR